MGLLRLPPLCVRTRVRTRYHGPGIFLLKRSTFTDGPKRTLLTTSYIVGPQKPPLLTETIPEHLQSIVSRYGNRPAVVSVHQNRSLTYSDLDRDSTRLALGLKQLGVGKGDRVAVSLGNNIEFATTTFALFKLGAILVPLNPAFSAEQVVAALNRLTASHLIVGAETNLPRKSPLSNIPLLSRLLAGHSQTRVESEAVPSLRHVVLVDNANGRVDTASFAAVTAYQDIAESVRGLQDLPDQGLDAGDVVNIQFTSGTTSMPKAACLTHSSILNNGRSIGDRMLLTEEDVVCCPPPLFHCFGAVLGYMATATHGSSIVFPSEAFSAHATLSAVQSTRATALYGVPTMFLSELELLSNGAVPQSPEGFSRLRTGIAAGSSVPSELMKKLHRQLNLTQLTICYGMTETSPVSCMTTTEDPLEKRVGTVGRLLPHVTLKVVEPSKPSVVKPIGQRGEIAVAGYLVMKGYWGDAERTAEVLIPDEKGTVFMMTGDEGFLDEDGYLTITGRIKDLIIRGGENIHPLDIEDCLLAHPAVVDVSAIGVSDERYGEVVGVFVIPRKGREVVEEDIRDWVRQRLAKHLVPKHVFWTEAFPRTASGKVQKFKLKEEAAQLLGRKKGEGEQ